jgi:hypothetical protein
LGAAVTAGRRAHRPQPRLLLGPTPRSLALTLSCTLVRAPWVTYIRSASFQPFTKRQYSAAPPATHATTTIVLLRRGGRARA